MILSEKEIEALREVVALGQNSGLTPPTRTMWKAAKWAGRVLAEQRANGPR